MSGHAAAKVEVPPDIVDSIARAKKISVLTGAGVSAESGIPTFRGAGGMWEKYDIWKLATVRGFEENPQLVWEWYQHRQAEVIRAKPNAAHETIAEMERYFDVFTVVTQNIDGMHARAGSRNIVELHGNIWRMRCVRDSTVMDLTAPVKEIPPLCQCGSLMRPDVVWFGEQLPEEAIERASKAAVESDVMFVIGTSAQVYPAAALPVLTHHSGGKVIEVNLEPTSVTDFADASFFAPAGSVMPVVWRAVVSSESFMKRHPIIPHR